MIEINIIYGLILAVMILVLGEGFLFSKRESRDDFAYILIPEISINITRNISSISEDNKPNSKSFLGFKLTIKRRQFLKALFLDFSPCHS